MFIGRDRELSALEAELRLVRESGAGRLVWMRGRRRVGKSRLVQELCDRSGAPYAFFQAPRREQPAALAAFVEAVAESTLPAAPAFDGAAYASWPAALRAAVQGLDRESPAILVIDELPYLAELDPGFAGDLQQAWDRTIEKAPLLLVCVGSDARMMEALVGERAPMFGRPTRELRVAPLDPRAVAEITSAGDAAEAFDRYLVLGGFPLLATSWGSATGLGEFLRAALVDDQAPLATTALWIMASEFEGRLQAEKVLQAIGHGESAYSRISARSGVKGNTLGAALDVLIEQKGLVRRSLPYAVPPGRKAAKYTIADPYLRFWLRFVGPHMEELSRGRPDLLIGRIERDWEAYRGRAIEPLVRAALERLLDEPELSDSLGGARHVGAWWRRDHSVEVDLVGGDRPDPTAIGFVGSVKWRERGEFSAEDLARLARQRAQVSGAEGAKLVAVSRSGFEDGLDAAATFGPDRLLAAWEQSSIDSVFDNGS
ncbi:MAG TPA: ATP-binding protein [Solirubrobacterales bacterium]|nr:ATP-binding protein [Solirubrobacterales bacterium]